MPQATGSSWCVLAAAPQQLDATAVLACEVRWTVLAVGGVTGATLHFGSGGSNPSDYLCTNTPKLSVLPKTLLCILYLNTILV